VKKISKNEITAVILAGGQASRMDGEDKGLIVFRELPLISHVINITNLKLAKFLLVQTEILKNTLISVK